MRGWLLGGGGGGGGVRNDAQKSTIFVERCCVVSLPVYLIRMENSFKDAAIRSSHKPPPSPPLLAAAVASFGFEKRLRCVERSAWALSDVWRRMPSTRSKYKVLYTAASTALLLRI